MTLETFATKYPCLWHVTFSNAFDTIRQHGFLRPIDLVDDCDTIREGEPHNVRGPDDIDVVLRDQILSRRDPTPYLDGLTTQEWWLLINSRVYFFCRAKDADKLVRSYRDRGYTQDVIKLRTAPLLGPVADHVELATVNAGVFPRKRGPARGRHTFVPLRDFPQVDLGKVKEATVATRFACDDEAAAVSVVRHEVDGTTRRVWP